MPFPTSSIGSTTEPSVLAVDARATMAFASGIGDANPAYLDTTRPGGVVAHPLFVVRPEWPAVRRARRSLEGVLTAAEAHGGLHVAHDLVVHRLVIPGDELHTTATVESLAHHRAGALEVLRLETLDHRGDPVATTRFTLLFPGVAVEEDAGAADPRPSAAPAEPAAPVTSTRRALPAGAAHVYTECAQIWNPIHTDPVAARRAGLPRPVLHGTATLAMAISDVIDRHGGGDPACVRRVRARFGASVTLPSTIEIRSGAPTGSEVAFEVLEEAGGRAVRDASATLDLHGAPVHRR